MSERESPLLRWARLKSAIANVSVDNELLREKIARLEDGRPLAFWKWKP